MNIFLWICQGILAAAFLYSGIFKAYFSKQKLLAIGQTGVGGLHDSTIRFIGISEIVGVIGIILPWTLNIFPILTPAAALCFMIIMILAARVHYKLKEPRNVSTNVFLFILSAIVFIFRLQEVFL
jgi:hypothetical protein